MDLAGKSILGVFLVAVWLILTIPNVVEAHALGAEAKLKDGRVTIEAFYDDNTPAISAKVVVTQAERLIVEGKTDQDGRWSFDAPKPGQYKVVVDGGAGHRATVNLTIPENKRSPPPSTTQDASSSADASKIQADDGVIVSEGPTRSEFTGWQRSAMAVAGVVLIGVASFVLTRFLRVIKKKSRTLDGA